MKFEKELYVDKFISEMALLGTLWIVTYSWLIENFLAMLLASVCGIVAVFSCYCTTGEVDKFLCHEKMEIEKDGG